MVNISCHVSYLLAERTKPERDSKPEKEEFKEREKKERKKE